MMYTWRVVSAFAGRSKVLEAYRHAVEQKY
jgi:S-adenosylmethionine:tRNA-ribosyltransferase-isomerase (queuine synthetase)